MKRGELTLLSSFELKGKTVLVRVNYDVPLDAKGNTKIEVADDTRIIISLKTIKYLLAKKCRLIILSHLDRPGGIMIPELSLKPVVFKLRELLPQINIGLSPEVLGETTKKMVKDLKSGEVLILENLRFEKQEEADEVNFAQNLASLGDFYVNEAFADCHRQHASIVGVPKFLPAAAGFELAKEVKILTKVYKKPKRPVIIILGGKKKDKLKFVKALGRWADFILVGGSLPRIAEKEGASQDKISWASLTKTGKDITLESAQRFSKIIRKGKTIIWNGTLGFFEEEGNQQGTRITAEAVVSSQAFKVAGGGDTEAALTRLGWEKKFDFISSGGGAMLEFLAVGDLPGLKALRKNRVRI